MSKIAEVLKTDREIYAHISDKNETLKQHVDCCEKYFYRLLEKEKMKETLEKLESSLLEGITETCYIEWFRDSLKGIITFHDFGKVNPLFQKYKMKNKAFNEVKIGNIHNENHSMLSTYFYLDYYLAQLEVLKEETPLRTLELCFLIEVLLLNAFVIMKHHSSIKDFSDLKEDIKQGGALDELEKHIKNGEYEQIYCGKFSNMSISRCINIFKNIQDSEERKFTKYIYVKLMFSLLTACDYYATTEFESNLETTYFGSVQELDDLYDSYEETELVKKIREFSSKTLTDSECSINDLRNRLFLEAEDNLLKNMQDNIFFLEAPTGCGKTNVAFNCSFLLAKSGMGKIIYTYPFNNLIEQNKGNLENIFKDKDIFEKIAIVNSVTPIKLERVKEEEKKKKEKMCEDDNPSYYQRALLDRQFLNYPIILTTNVNLFQTMFGTEREAAFSFHQLVGSVIVLDEIQSYKNSIWTELMMFLQYFSKYLNCKVIIMSATLPDLTYLTGNDEKVTKLIRNRDFYFKNDRFKNRVRISYDLINKKATEDMLYEHIKRQSKKSKKILVEFINKDMAYRFFERLENDNEITIPIERMTGDDNKIDRVRILEKLKDNNYCKNGCILVATQVIEAGVDIDMDIGYKDISILDSEEQFMGRINRNNWRMGIVYFFNLYDAKKIYSSNDYRISDELTLMNAEMRILLVEKDFEKYYSEVLKRIKEYRNGDSGDSGIRYFIEEDIDKLRFKKIEDRMRLIDENDWHMSVFLAREITLENGEKIDGKEVWTKYCQLLTNQYENYAEFRYKLSEINAKLSLFLYSIKKNSNLQYHDRIGEIYYLSNGDDYFEDNRLNKRKLKESGALFIEI